MTGPTTSDAFPDSSAESLPDEAVDSLMRSVTTARWFAGKGRRAEFRSITWLPWLDDTSDTSDASAAGGDEVPRVRLAVLEVGYPDEARSRPDGAGEAADPEDPPGHVELYQLALAYRRDAVDALAFAEQFRLAGDGVTDAQVVYDATQDPAGAGVLLRSLLAGSEVADEVGRVTFHVRDAAELSPDLPGRAFRGQQSNTSVMYGDVAMLKLFRRLELGRNLDIQVHAALNDAGVADVARIFGWVDATWSSGTAYGPQVLGADLAMCVEKLADAEDGWDLALAGLTRETSDETAETAEGSEGLTGFAVEAEALGRALALTHHALRDAFGTAELAGSTLAEVMDQRLAAAAAVAPALAPYADGLQARFDALDSTELTVQRVHGDFHLGQTLHTPSGWKIIDFEGEPAKSLAERVAPDSVWRDVAGMMRSFDYAAASVPGGTGPAWRDRCRDAFLNGYTDGAGLDASEEGLLAAYEADKAVYEVVYEVRNRPDWIAIPLGAVATLAAPVDSADPATDPPADPPSPAPTPENESEHDPEQHPEQTENP